MITKFQIKDAPNVQFQRQWINGKLVVSALEYGSDKVVASRALAPQIGLDTEIYNNAYGIACDLEWI